MATRTKTKVFTNVTLEQAQEASKDFAKAKNKLLSIEAKMNAEIDKVKSKYQDDITDLNDSIIEPNAILQAFANEQQSSWGKKKSMELLHTIIGFRTGTPKLDKEKGQTWTTVTEKLQQYFPAFVRTKVEPDKEALIALRDDESFDAIAKKCKISVVQDETFFVEPKKEEV